MIRKAKIEDVIELTYLEELVFDKTLGINFLISEIESNEFAHYFVYEINKEIIGYIGIRIYDTNVEVFNFLIKPSFQGKGYGLELFNYLLTYLKPFNILNITLEVRKSNKRALAFYNKQGFIKSHIRKNYYNNNEDAYVLIKEVS